LREVPTDWVEWAIIIFGVLVAVGVLVASFLVVI
jgi:hypothetical protein